jgi:predicted nuclease of predicted toxin-antitoxin system
MMARLDADELFPRVVVELLRLMIHNILTVEAAGKENPKNPDEEVLAFAVSENRAVLTLNRRYFIRLHSLQSDRAGIIVCKPDHDLARMAANINEAISSLATLTNQLIRVYRSGPSSIS